MTAVLPAPRDGVATHFLSGTGVLSTPVLNLLAPPTGPVDLNGQRITGLPVPTTATEPATKTYADALSGGLDPKDSVRVATTANINLTATQTIDGVAVIAGDRVLVKNQTTGSQNGIYVVASGAWARSSDADNSPAGEVTAGLYTFVEEGTQADSGWVLITNNPITLGTTALSFTQFSGGGGGGAASDATLSLSDILTGNTNPSRHGFAPKTTGYAGHYLGGDGAWHGLYGFGSSIHAHYVDAGAAPGGDGNSPITAFTTVNGAIAAAQPFDDIFVLSDMPADNIAMNKQGIRLLGVGNRRMLLATSSTAFNNYTINVTTIQVSIENFIIRGHANFRGVHMMMNQTASYARLKNIRIEGAGLGGAVTFYPTTPDAGTGLGGVGIAYHMCDIQRADDLEIASCSIGIAAGTWCTRIRSQSVQFAGNAQCYVEGINTGAAGAPAATGPWAYGGAAQNGANHFSDWCGVSPYFSSSTTPTFHLIGDGSSNSTAISGNQYESLSFEESGGGQVCFRIGTADNVFIGCAWAQPCELQIRGQHNTFINSSFGNVGIEVSSNRNSFDGIRAGFAQFARLYGGGSYNVFRNTDINIHPSSTLSGAGNKFENCLWVMESGGVTPSRARLGAYPDITFRTGHLALTYGATLQPQNDAGSVNSVVVTNNVQFRILNPRDYSNQVNPDNIMCTNDLTLHIRNGTAGALTNAILWGDVAGSKFVLSGPITNPGAGKDLAIDFYYNFTLDRWIEKGRVLHT